MAFVLIMLNWMLASSGIRTECALGALVQRWPNLGLADADPPWIEEPLHRGLRTLDLHCSI